MARAPRSSRAPAPVFDAIIVEGALIAPAMLARIAERAVDGQGEADYAIPKGLSLRDEVARYFRIGQAQFETFDATPEPTVGATVHFVEELLRDVFGFADIARIGSRTLDDRTWAVTLEALGGRVPIIVVPPGDGLDAPSDHLPTDGRRRSASTALQDWLNANDDALWGLCSNGVQLRLMRDNASLTRPAYIDADLRTIFENEGFADFAALWLLIHRTRFGAAENLPGECFVERWRDKAESEGVAARDRLRDGVEAALLALGNGFLAYPENGELRARLAGGDLPLNSYFSQLLRLVYRLIFLFAAEDRDLLHPPETAADARRLYAEGYSVASLRARAVRRSAWDRHHDLWVGLQIVFAGLARGEQALAMPALGGLFARDSLNDLDGARLANRALMEAVFRLAWLREKNGLVPVNWRDMETEELGSVYESLLELTPRLADEGRSFAFAEGDETRGNARKTTGSYYTPDSLVSLLLDTTLDPVLDAAVARNPDDPASEILKLAIVDPACGSGHFLLGAARRAAGRIARHRSAGAPSQAAFQQALREVVSRCIYGVDRNPMAVELCKVALWIEALEPGKPLTFLDSHIRCGDSLIGVFDYEMLKRGIPDAAYKPLTGDDKAAARGWGKHNKQQREGRGATGFLAELRPPATLVDTARAVMEMPEETLDEVATKRAAFERLHSGAAWLNLKTACDLYVAAFFAPKTGDAPEATALARPAIPTTDHVWTAARGESVYGPLVATGDDLATSVGAFHWPIEFPQVFARGGFDAVIGNPPWERIKLQEKEFFAARSPEIAHAPNKAARDRMIRALADASPESFDGRLYADFQFAKRAAEAASEFARGSGRYPLTGTGDVNTYALFAEHFDRTARDAGRSGVIVPTGIATDSTTSAFFGSLIERKRLAAFIDFENRERIFVDVYFRVRFCILAMGATDEAFFACLLTDPLQVADKDRQFTLSPEQIARINPNTKTAPVFRSHADAELTTKLYDNVPVLIEEHPDEQGGDVNPWGIAFQAMFHMSNDSNLFRSAETLEEDGWVRDGPDWLCDGQGGVARMVPLYEAKMVHHFNYRYGDFRDAAVKEDADYREIPQADVATLSDPYYEPTPRYWVPEEEVKLRAARVPAALKRAFRDDDGDKILKCLAEWLAGYHLVIEGRNMRERDLVVTLDRGHAWRAVLGVSPDRFLASPKTIGGGTAMQRATPLTHEDAEFLTNAPDDPLVLAAALIERKQPRWLMGWRDITNATNERTVVASVFPKVGTNHKLPLMYHSVEPQFTAGLVAMLASLAFDFIARQKVGGTSLTYFYLKQFAALPPSAFSEGDLAFITPRVLELTYTSRAMRPWAEDLGHAGPPFGWDEARRAQLRADLDAFIARKYGLTRDELRYVLDPTDVKGPDYPSETFRVLKQREERELGEYRTQRLVLEAWDALERVAPAPGAVAAKMTARVRWLRVDGARSSPKGMP